jgi:protein-S-isoprenylcysteine O-methyltransferase Ste14
MQQLLAGWTQGAMLLLVGLMAFAYFLPSILAFWLARRRFYVVLVLNLVVSPAQGLVLASIAPQLLMIDVSQPVHAWVLFALANLGPGWLALLVSALMPGAADPRLAAARETKLFDVLAALPLVIWFGFGALNLRPTLLFDLGLIVRGAANLLTWAQFLSLLAAAAFNLLLVWLLLVRDKPVRRGKGVLGRVFGFAGTFLGVGMLQLPPAQLGLAMQLVSSLLVGVGSLGSLLVLWRLGAAFSIMPEARVLVTRGPYAYARHPLYAVEMLTIIGTAMLFAQPWAALIALGVLMLLVVRSHYEEQVLTEAYPEYVAYRAKTARFVPGVI